MPAITNVSKPMATVSFVFRGNIGTHQLRKWRKKLMVQIGAHYVEPLDQQGEPITRHRRRFGNTRTDAVDARTTLARLLKNPGAWRNSGMRVIMPDNLRDHMDVLDKSGLREVLPSIKELSLLMVLNP
jgi:hypothetical protein